jgi:hypothetical protein
MAAQTRGIGAHQWVRLISSKVQLGRGRLTGVAQVRHERVRAGGGFITQSADLSNQAPDERLLTVHAGEHGRDMAGGGLADAVVFNQWPEVLKMDRWTGEDGAGCAPSRRTNG